MDLTTTHSDQLWRDTLKALGDLHIPGRVSASGIAAILEWGRRSKPLGYDTVVTGIAQRYRGDQKEIVRSALVKRYEKTGDEMPVNPLNWLAFFARSDAGVYVGDADRWLELDGKRLPDTDARTGVFSQLVEQASLQTVAPEVERRALAAAKAIAVEVSWARVEDKDPGVPTLTIFWTCDVFVITHPSMPADDRAIIACGLRRTPASSKAGEHIWTIHSRGYTDVGGRPTSWGPWREITVRSDGAVIHSSRENLGKRLPVVFLRLEQPDGGFWPAPEADVLCQVDELNVSRSNEQHTVDMQGHSWGVYKGTEHTAAHIVLSPGRFMRIGPQESLDVIDPNPKIEEMLASRQQATQEIAMARSNNPDAYSTTKSAAVSGISRAVANIPHDKRIRELRPVLRRFEEQRLLPTLLEQAALYGPSGWPDDLASEGLQARVEFPPPPDYEELDQKQRRLEIDLKLGVISVARYAVLMGHHPNVEAARKAGLSDVITPMATPTPSTAGEHEQPPTSDAPPPVAVPADAPSVDAPVVIEDVAKAAYNGAQLASMSAIVADVATGQLPRASGVAMLELGFQLTTAEAERIMGEAGKGFVPTTADEAP